MKRVNVLTVSMDIMSPKMQTDFIVKKLAIFVRDTARQQENVFHVIWDTT